MKTRSALRPFVLTALLSLVSIDVLCAQSASPSPTANPAKPVAEAGSSSPAAAASPSPTAAPLAKPEKPPRTAEEKAARKTERLRKYDTNKDGHLDESERAAMRADKAKASPTP